MEHLSGLFVSIATQDDLLHWGVVLQQACVNTLQLFTLRTYACPGIDAKLCVMETVTVVLERLWRVTAALS